MERGDIDVTDGPNVTPDLGVATDDGDVAERSLRALHEDASTSEIIEPNEIRGDERVGAGPDTGEVATPTLAPV